MDVETAMKWSWKRLTASGVVFEGHGLIKLLIVTPHANKKTQSTMYNGVTVGGEIKLDIQTPTGQTIPVPFEIPLRITTGFYVSMDGDCYSVSVQYLEDLKR